MSEKVVLKQNKKLGYQASKGRRINYGFMTIEVDDMHYCVSHDFWYNKEEQNKLLHEGKPCFFTDYRYVSGKHNSYGQGAMMWSRNKGFTLKKAIRLINKTRNLPVGTIVKITHNCYGISKGSRKNFSLGYNFIVKKENKFDPQYEVSQQFNADNFNTDDKAKNLTDLLRANGFNVRVNSKNTNFLSSMISTAASYVGKNVDADDDEGEIATAYGHGLRVGYSSNDSTYRGYSYGVNSILFDKWDEFDKWSRCIEISKEMSNEEILKILLNVKNETN